MNYDIEYPPKPLDSPDAFPYFGRTPSGHLVLCMTEGFTVIEEDDGAYSGIFHKYNGIKITPLAKGALIMLTQP